LGPTFSGCSATYEKLTFPHLTNYSEEVDPDESQGRAYEAGAGVLRYGKGGPLTAMSSREIAMALSASVTLSPTPIRRRAPGRRSIKSDHSSR